MVEEQKDIIEKITHGIISFLDFLKKFKKVKYDDIINDDKSKFSYAFRRFNLECYIIDKKYFDEFRASINFNNLIYIIETINEENKNKFKEGLKKYLEKNPYKPNGENIKLYSKEEELKEIVKNFNEYSFVNKELLCDVMGVPESKLNENIIKVSKNERNTYLSSTINNYIIKIRIEKKKDENKSDSKKQINKEYKNLYYVEDITKKIFVLLYFNDQLIQKKMSKNIKDIYNFKKYYLINNNWINEYKEFFLYHIIKNKLDYEYKNKNCSLKKINYYLNDIIKNKIRQIRLYSDTKLPDFIRNAYNLECKEKSNVIKKDNNKNNHDYWSETIDPEEKEYIYTPTRFNLINEEIYQLLIKEEFFYNMDDIIKNKICFEMLLGNNQIIIKKKINRKYHYFIYSYNNQSNEEEEKYILKYILNYDKEELFFKNFDTILKKGLEYYISDEDLNEKNYEKKLYDNNKNVLGKFININMNKEDIKNNLAKININKEDIKNNLGKKDKQFNELIFMKDAQISYYNNKKKINSYNNYVLVKNGEIKYIGNNIEKKEELKELIEKLILEKNNLKNNLINNNINNNSINSLNPGEKIIAVFFSSTNQDIHRPIPCKNTDTFARIEEKIYNEYPKYKDCNTYLTVNGKVIKRFKTFDENKIKDGDTIIVNIYDD